MYKLIYIIDFVLEDIGRQDLYPSSCSILFQCNSFFSLNRDSIFPPITLLDVQTENKISDGIIHIQRRFCVGASPCIVGGIKTLR